MKLENQPFVDSGFISAFENRRIAEDSVNRLVDEPALFELLPPISGARILDFGCGLGDISRRMASMGANVVAVDTSSAMIGKAVELDLKRQVDFRVGGVEIAESSGPYDIVVSTMVLHFVDDLKSLLSAIAGVMASNGFFVFSQRHPIRTSYPNHSNGRDQETWPVSKYFEESERSYEWLGYQTKLYHRTISTILDTLSQVGLRTIQLVEPFPEIGRAHV